MSNAVSTDKKYVDAAKTNKIANRQMKHVEIDGKEILIANIDGKFYAINDRCGHMNALLSMGNLAENVVTCAFHGARFDITTGKKMKDPVLTPSQQMELLPKNGKNIRNI